MRGSVVVSSGHTEFDVEYPPLRTRLLEVITGVRR
jgi:hypothetical protein